MPGALHAKQISFNANTASDSTTFQYAWLHSDDSLKSISFALDDRSLLSMPGSPPAFSNERMRDELSVQLIRFIRQIDPKMASVELIQESDGFSFKVKAKDHRTAQKTLADLERQYEQLRNSYWQRNLLIPTETNGYHTTIQHDYRAYISQSATALESLVESFKQIQTDKRDIREFIELVLSWMQSIPYASLGNSRSINSAGFISPRDVLIQNRGDCDSKSTLMSSILKAYDPRLDVRMMYLEDHALLAVANPNSNDEVTISYNGKPFVLIEPTGPARYVIGQVADSTLQAVNNRQFELKRLW